MNKEIRITVRVEKTERDKIEALIKQKYPVLRNFSDVIRAALKEFLAKTA